MDIAARLEAVEQENEMLRERIAQLEIALGAREEVPLELGLSAHEAILFGAIFKREVVTKETAMAVLYRNFGKDDAEEKIVDVYVCKIRRKVKPFGIKITTHWGQGYSMPAASKAIVREMRSALPETDHKSNPERLTNGPASATDAFQSHKTERINT